MMHGCIPVIVMDNVSDCAPPPAARAHECCPRRCSDHACYCCAPRLPARLLARQVHVSFESILDAESYTVRIPEADCEKLPELLQAYTQKQIAAMQRNVAKVWQR